METTRANSITAAQNMHSKRRPVRGAISKAKIWWKKTVCLQMWVQMWRQVKNVASKQCGAKMWLQAQMWWRLRNDGNVASNNVASKCGVKHKCGGASENDRNVASNNVASGTNVVAVRNVASNNVASKCGVRHSLCQTVFQEMCLQKRYSVAGTKVLH